MQNCSLYMQHYCSLVPASRIKNRKKEENYDSVLITEYSNIYDETTNRLISVQIAEILNLYFGDANNKAYQSIVHT